MPALLTALGWAAAHLAVYAAALRRLRVFGRETVILGYHAASCAGLAVVVLVLGPRAALADAVLAALSLHGLYSMSFLVLWASSQGGFSLRLLKELEAGPRSRAELVEAFARLGDAKRRQRLSSLRRSGWVRQDGDRFRTTAAGAALARALTWLHRINAYERTG